MTMSYRLFGRTGLRVSKIFLGAMTFGDEGGVGAPLEECRRIVDAYADAGGNVIDTAVNYRGGASEEILGELLPGPPRPLRPLHESSPERSGSLNARRHSIGDQPGDTPSPGSTLSDSP
jgi:predicted aldo/keto reductase-like oxidoreductase